MLTQLIAPNKYFCVMIYCYDFGRDGDVTGNYVT